MTTTKNKKKVEFFQLSVHFIFAIILSNAFFIASQILIPFENISKNDENFGQAMALMMIFLIILIGWTAYARSMSYRGHADNALGTFRFFVDILILFLYFYFLETINKNEFVYSITWINLLIFLCFLVWDILRYYEYKKFRNFHKERLKPTIYMFIFALIIYVFDLLMIQENLFDFEWSNSSNSSTIIILLLLIGFQNSIYRIWKWNPEGNLTFQNK